MSKLIKIREFFNICKISNYNPMAASLNSAEDFACQAVKQTSDWRGHIMLTYYLHTHTHKPGSVAGVIQQNNVINKIIKPCSMLSTVRG